MDFKTSYSFLVSTISGQTFLKYEIKKELGRTYEKTVLVGKPKGNNRLGDLRVDGRIIINGFLQTK
jgi:hypothetical protein